MSESSAAVVAQPAEQEALWVVEDVARYLRMSVSWVNHRVQDGTIPTLRIGRRIRFDPEAIKAFARGQAVPPARVVQFPGR